MIDKKEFNQDNLIYYEDALLTKNIIWAIESIHQLIVRRIWRHVRIEGYEVDALAICDTANEKFERYVGFELKENDIAKSIHQAKLRRHLCNYFYVVINLKVSSIVNYIIDYPNFKNLKLGIISKENVVVLPSKFVNIKNNNLKWEKYREVNPFQINLFHFLKENEGRWEVKRVK